MNGTEQRILASLQKDQRISSVESGNWGGEKRFLVHLKPGYVFPDGSGTRSVDTAGEARNQIRKS